MCCAPKRRADRREAEGGRGGGGVGSGNEGSTQETNVRRTEVRQHGAQQEEKVPLRVLWPPSFFAPTDPPTIETRGPTEGRLFALQYGTWLAKHVRSFGKTRCMSLIHLLLVVRCFFGAYQRRVAPSKSSAARKPFYLVCAALPLG